MKQLAFNSFKDFFEYQFKKNYLNDRNSNYTLLDLSLKLGHKSSSLLSMIATGRRLPSKKVLHSLFDEWEIKQNERTLVILKLEVEKRKKNQKPYLELLNQVSKLEKKSNSIKIELDQFNHIKDWYNVVILNLITTETFIEDHYYLSIILKKKVTPYQIKKSIESLLRIGLIFRDNETGNLRTLNPNMRKETTHDIPSEAIRDHHKGMIQRGLEAIDEVEVKKRSITGLTLRFQEKDLTEAKKDILNFLKEFNDKYNSEVSTDIFQLNLQFFPHTQLVTNTKQEVLQ